MNITPYMTYEYARAVIGAGVYVTMLGYSSAQLANYTLYQNMTPNALYFLAFSVPYLLINDTPTVLSIPLRDGEKNMFNLVIAFCLLMPYIRLMMDLSSTYYPDEITYVSSANAPATVSNPSMTQFRAALTWIGLVQGFFLVIWGGYRLARQQCAQKKKSKSSKALLASTSENEPTPVISKEKKREKKTWKSPTTPVLWMVCWIVLIIEVVWCMMTYTFPLVWQIIDSPFLMLYVGLSTFILYPGNKHLRTELFLLFVGCIMATIYMAFNIMNTESAAVYLDLASYNAVFQTATPNQTAVFRDLFYAQVSSPKVGAAPFEMYMRDIIDMLVFTMGWAVFWNQFGEWINSTKKL